MSELASKMFLLYFVTIFVRRIQRTINYSISYVKEISLKAKALKWAPSPRKCDAHEIPRGCKSKNSSPPPYIGRFLNQSLTSPFQEKYFTKTGYSLPLNSLSSSLLATKPDPGSPAPQVTVTSSLKIPFSTGRVCCC